MATVKKIKKAQNGDRTVDLPDVKIGYKAKVIEKVNPEGVRTAKVKVKRNVGGLLLGKKKGVTGNLPVYNVPQGKRESPERERSGRAGMKEAQDGAFFNKLSKNKKPETSSKVMTKEEVGKRTIRKPTPGVMTFDFKKPGVKINLKSGGKVKKNWIQSATASIKKRGTAGKCTPITKPGCTGRAKALAKTFKKMAKARKGK